MKRTLLLLIITLFALSSCVKKSSNRQDAGAEVPLFCADSAYRYVAEQCEFGPRVPGTKAHKGCADYLIAKFASFHADSIIVQSGNATLYDGTRSELTNIIAQYGVDKNVRIAICAHWDSRPFADMERDENLRRTPIDGANDGASGVGVILELARIFSQKAPNIGIDLMLFDLEDYGAPDFSNKSGGWALGSEYWAMRQTKKEKKLSYAILLDMVGAPDAQFYREQYSDYYASWVVDKCWRKAQQLGYDNIFINRQGGVITDDHVAMNAVAGVPTIDIVHYNPHSESGFPATWHTHQDNISNISAEMLGKVGYLLVNLIYE